MRHLSLINLQLCACVLGMLAAFTPGVSFTGLFTGMDYVSVSGAMLFTPDDPRVQVTSVMYGSPAARAGFREGDVFQRPASFRALKAAEEAVRLGEKQVFTIKRGETEMTIEGVHPKAELAAIWYASAWDPVAGALFLCLGILLFATGPLVPVPWWRSIPVSVAGIGIAVGFAVEMLWNVHYSSWALLWRLRIYNRWPMGGGDEWDFHQGLVGMAAGILLAVFAAAEIRKRLGMSLPPTATLRQRSEQETSVGL